MGSCKSCNKKKTFKQGYKQFHDSVLIEIVKTQRQEGKSDDLTEFLNRLIELRRKAGV